MFAQTPQKLSLAVLIAVGAVATSSAARADQAGLVVRTFGFYASGGAWEDFQSEESIAVTVLPELLNFGQSVEFSAFTDEEDVYDNTVWVANAAHHALIGGPQAGGTYFWLVTADTPEPPQIGAHTFTGPDSPFILSQELVYISLCNGTCGFGNDSKYRYVLSGGTPFVIVTAIFSR